MASSSVVISCSHDCLSCSKDTLIIVSYKKEYDNIRDIGKYNMGDHLIFLEEDRCQEQQGIALGQTLRKSLMLPVVNDVDRAYYNESDDGENPEDITKHREGSQVYERVQSPALE